MTRFRSLLYLPMLLLALSPVFSSAQSLIKGALVDENNEPLPYAGAMLLQAADSSLVKGEVSDDAGVFRFQDVIAGQYYVAISMVGYEDHYSELLDISSSTGNLDLGLIAMEPAALNLDAVEVKAKKPLFEQRIDPLIFSIDANLCISSFFTLSRYKSPSMIVQFTVEKV